MIVRVRRRIYEHISRVALCALSQKAIRFIPPPPNGRLATNPKPVMIGYKPQL